MGPGGGQLLDKGREHVTHYGWVVPCVTHYGWVVPCVTHYVPCVTHYGWVVPCVTHYRWVVPCVTHYGWVVPCCVDVLLVRADLELLARLGEGKVLGQAGQGRAAAGSRPSAPGHSSSSSSRHPDRKHQEAGGVCARLHEQVYTHVRVCMRACGVRACVRARVCACVCAVRTCVRARVVGVHGSVCVYG